jgi:hypothetical protein
MVVLSDMKSFRKIIRRWWFNNDHVDEYIENLLHENSIR